MNSVKVIAMYLPQYHQIPENDEFWGRGYTDWVSVKKAKPQYRGHVEPRIPLNDNYYDLAKKENVAWQAKIAKEHGVEGFGIYHYWFNNEKNLLTKPSQIILENKDIDIDFMFVWDNSCWKRSWSNVKGNDWSSLEENQAEHKGPAILIPYILGTEKDWENHFNYLLPFFKDQRYIKKDNRPVFMIFNYDSDIEKMSEYWDKLAKKNGFDGIYVIYRYYFKSRIPSHLNRYEYQPHGASWWSGLTFKRVYYKILAMLKIDGLQIYNYDKVWKRILETARKRKAPNFYHGGFVDYDDTPRRGPKAKIIKRGTPRKFRKYMSELLSVSKQQKKEWVFVTAWNEWGEGAYLEPDTINKYAYLDALKQAVEDNK